jgi:hypothetical protein
VTGFNSFTLLCAAAAALLLAFLPLAWDIRLRWEHRRSPLADAAREALAETGRQVNGRPLSRDERREFRKATERIWDEMDARAQAVEAGHLSREDQP